MIETSSCQIATARSICTFRRTRPGAEKEGNWLPVAKAPFNLLMRLYWPSEEILNDTWTPPLVTRVE